MLTVDASVWVNADSPAEAESASSRAFLDRVVAARTPIIVPTLLRVEVAAAISRTRKDAALAREYSEKLAALPFVRWIALDPPLAARASVLAADHALRGADAVYAAVAIVHGCELISLDQEHLTRLASVLAVRTPSQSLAAGSSQF
ncbi:MAG TPA: type II toxin-antitoxin system VapC family toxin [Phycisphaerae bacterium]|nr:type II toxin-antitoxin system VapC family toxin [Phycisphaerae bacterium]